MFQLTELTRKLKEIFQINRADLDFGIYRILNTRSQEIERYLSQTLPQKVKQALGDNQSEQIAQWQNELVTLQKTLEDAGSPLESSTKYQELQNKIEQAKKGSADHETAVYRHLLTFFSRYYEEGDFISQRRYKGDTYAVPYAGEEVLLHWANKDQYYTKSGENFSNYRFSLDDGRTVFFRLNSADIAKDNRKDNDAKRLFTLATAQTIERENEDGELEIIDINPITQSEDGNTLTILFDYKPFEKSVKQEKILEQDLATLQAHDLLQTKWIALAERCPTDKNPNRTLLEKHLSDYTQKNTADYFIHKDLGGFLRRELDFYIKNEVMHLDDIQSAQAFAHIEANLRLIQTLRKIALEIIDFLAQLENFQKKLWLKKKFVANCHYLITLNHIPQTFHETIFANAKQREQWQNLFAVKNLDIHSISIDDSNPYAYLVVDTSLFPAEFQSQLLTALSAQCSDSLDAHINGTLIHSDNFQALNLLQARYREQVKCIYIDPPFNLGINGDFLYKTDYKDSSWLTLLDNRIQKSLNLLCDDGFFYLRCDHNGNFIAKQVLNNNLGKDNFEAELLVQRIRKNITGQGKITLPLANDSLFLYSASPKSKFVNPYLKLKEIREAYWRRIDDSAGFRNPPEREIFGKIFKPYKYDAHFKYSQKSIDAMIKEGRIRLRCKGKDCKYEHYEGKWITCPLCGSQDATPQYLVQASDKQVLDTNWLDITGYAHTTGFPTENSEILLQRCLDVASSTNDLILDYFSGSGTTACVAQKLKRKWLAIEQGEYFESVLKVRIQKTLFGEQTGISKSIDYKGGGIVKVLKLESYEDTLNNLELRRSGLFDKLPKQAQHDYLLHYMLNIESRDSLLNVSHFAKPFDYGLNISTTSAGAYDWQKVDLVETFNYLIGAKVIGVDDKRTEQGFVAVECRLPNQNSDEKTLIFWRDCERIGYDELQKQFDRLNINPANSEYSQVYVNGDHTLETVWDGEQSGSLKIISIEDVFLSLMFEGEA